MLLLLDRGCLPLMLLKLSSSLHYSSSVLVSFNLYKSCKQICLLAVSVSSASSSTMRDLLKNESAFSLMQALCLVPVLTGTSNT